MAIEISLVWIGLLYYQFQADHSYYIQRSIPGCQKQAHMYDSEQY